MLYCIAGNFRVVQIFMFFAPQGKRKNKNRELLNAWTFELTKVWTRVKKHISSMALYRYFAAVEDVLSRPSGTLSSSISPTAIKQANEAVKSALTLVSKARGSYSKYTPEQQAMISEYASPVTRQTIDPPRRRYSEPMATAKVSTRLPSSFWQGNSSPLTAVQISL